MDVLLVDDDDGFLSATSRLLEILGHEVSTANSVQSAQTLLREADKKFEQVLIDLMLPDGNGLELLDLAFKNNERSHVTIITGNPAVKSLVKSMYGPRINYLIKPITLDGLKSLFREGTNEGARRSHEGQDKFHFGGLIGESSAMQELYEKIARVAQTNANVMLIGESGVGKEVVANAIHFVSKAAGEFVACNCGAFSRELIGSELFGHEKGAFTGAVTKKEGIFELADNGTVFLDEITEMPIDMQPNLLRVLETREFKRLGGKQNLGFAARVISATNRKESELITRKVLREDLYFRLAVFPIHIPPLRDRKQDIPALSHYFLGELNKDNDTSLKINEEALAMLAQHDWPGNVRELRHFIHRAFIMTPENQEFIRIDRIESPFEKKQAAAEGSSGITAGRTVSEVEKELILKTLEHTRQDKQAASEMLGISLKTLYNRLKAYEEENVVHAGD